MERSSTKLCLPVWLRLTVLRQLVFFCWCCPPPLHGLGRGLALRARLLVLLQSLQLLQLLLLVGLLLLGLLIGCHSSGHLLLSVCCRQLLLLPVRCNCCGQLLLLL